MIWLYRIDAWLMDVVARFDAWVSEAMDVDLDLYECEPGMCNLPPGHNGGHELVEMP